MTNPSVTQQVKFDAICVQFEQAWREGQTPSLESFLDSVSEAERPLLLPQLLLLELEYIEGAGTSPEMDAYLERFPSYRVAVRSTFKAHTAAAAEAVNSSENRNPEGTIDQQPITESAGSQIGRYKLLEQVGEGGMGVVYMAEQQRPVRRKVALKIIKPGMDTKQVIARFEAERQALAMMDHANIARVLDAGSTKSGRPYFVMELVRGIPITEYCDQNKLPTTERLELFVSVCRAVQHAHTKGIIHRDIKPSNVLVTHHDGVPIPKIIDFGVAKATNQQLTERTLFTAFAQMIGTPLYMSPEQAEMSGLDVDTRSDIYSLGVLLYELLTGTTPVDKKRMQTAAFDEIRRLIREEDPVKPSTAISTLGETAKNISMRRGTDTNRLRQSLTGELDWIVMKALEKDRIRRFQSASDFAEDVQCHLNGDTVEACPPTFSYRMQKFTRRYRTQVAVAGTFLGLLVGSTLVAWSLYAKARRATQEAVAATVAEQKAKSEVTSERDRAEANLAEVERLSTEWRKTHYIYNLTRAASAHSNHATDETQFFLSKCDESARNWEWGWLNNTSFSGNQKKQRLEGDPLVHTFAMSADGTKLAVLDTDLNLRIHHYPSGELLWKVATEINSAQTVSWSPDGTHVAVTSQLLVQPGRAVIWNLATQEKVWERNDRGSTGYVSFSPDGRHFALSRAREQVFEYWRLGDAKPSWIQPCRWYPQVIYSPDGQRVYVNEVEALSPTAKAVLTCYDVNSHEKLWKEERDAASMAILTPDAERIITGGPDNTLVEWDTKTGRERATFPSGNEEGCFFLCADASGQYLCSAYFNDAVVHDLKTKSILWTETSSVGMGVFTPSGDAVIALYEDSKSLQVREVFPSQVNVRLVGHERTIKSGFLTADESQLYTASTDGTLRKWDLRDGFELELRDPHRSFYAAAVSPRGDLYATGGPDGLKLWNLGTHTLIKAWGTEEAGTVYWIDFSPDGERMAAAGKPGITRVWDVGTQELIGMHQETRSDIDGLAFCSDDGKQLAILPRTTGQLTIWEVDSGEVLQTLQLGRPSGMRNARDVKWCAAKNLIAVGNGSTVEVWSLDAYDRNVVLQSHVDGVTSVCFNADGSRLFSGSLDGVMKVWDVDAHEQLLSLDAHKPVQGRGNSGHRGIETIMWSEKSQALITCGGDSVARVWETTKPTDEIGTRRQLVELARQTTDALYHRSPKQADVLSALKENEQLARHVRLLAIQIASVRKDRPSGPFQPNQPLPIKVTAQSFPLEFSDLREKIVAFAETASGNSLDRFSVSFTNNAEIEVWYQEVRNLIHPDNLTLAEVEAIVQPLIDEYPNSHQFAFILGMASARRGKWVQAYKYLNMSLERTRIGSEYWFKQVYELAPLTLSLKDTKRYEEICEQVVDHGFAFASDATMTRRSTKLLSLDANDIDPILIVKHIRTHPSPEVGRAPYWYALSLGFAEYRCGNFDATINALSKAESAPVAIAPNIVAPSKFLLALAHHKKGNVEKAKSLFSATEKEFLSPTFPPFGGNDYGGAWLDYLTTQLIYEEAKTSLGVAPDE